MTHDQKNGGIHLDPAIPLTIPADVEARLRKNEQAQRYRMNRKNKDIIKSNTQVIKTAEIDLLPVETVDIIHIGNLQNWTCACHEVPGYTGCWRRVDITKSGDHPDAPVLGHVIAGGRGGGHTANNLRIMKHACNADINYKIEAGDIAKTNSLRKKHQGVDLKGRKYTPKKKSKIPSRPGGMQSQGFGNKTKRAWPKRKFGQ